MQLYKPTSYLKVTVTSIVDIVKYLGLKLYQETGADNTDNDRD